MKKERGITLIALVITIIVLLILAGVSLSFVLGNNGVLTQSKTSVTENKKATAKEEVTMAWAACESDYWNAWAKDSSVSKGDFFEGNNGNPGLSSYLTTGTLTNFLYGENSTFDYEKSASEKYALTVNSKGEVTGILEVSGQSGEQQSGPAGNNSGQQGGSTEGNSVALSTLTSTNYGDYIDLGQNVIGESATTDDWRILYNDTTNNVVYAILADYLPNNNPAVTATGLNTSGTYSVYGNYGERDGFLAELNNATAWNSLIPNTVVSRGATARGGVTAELLMASYNEKHGTTFDYTDFVTYLWNDPSNQPSQQDRNDRNYSSEDLDSLYVPCPDPNLPNPNVGLQYGDPGYVDTWDLNRLECDYYYLASPGNWETIVWQVHSSGNIYGIWGYWSEGTAVRPVVSLPSNIQVTNNNGIWSLAE